MELKRRVLRIIEIRLKDLRAELLYRIRSTYYLKSDSPEILLKPSKIGQLKRKQSVSKLKRRRLLPLPLLQLLKNDSYRLIKILIFHNKSDQNGNLLQFMSSPLHAFGFD